MANRGLRLKQANDRARQRERAFLGLGWRAGQDALIDELSENERVEFEERAAIIEFDGEVSKPEAERLALIEFITNPKSARG